MAKATPLQQVKDQFGNKEKLVDALAGKLEARDGEGADDLKARLLRVSNKKLLRLLSASNRVTELGGKDKLVDTIITLKNPKQAKDADFRSKLAGYRITRLLDLHDSLAK
jgi:hypothetical protein